MFKPQTILVPIDLSESSHPAYLLALDLARQYHARLYLLHVAHPPGPEDISYTEAQTELQPEGYHNRLLQSMRQLSPPPTEVAVEYLVREGPPANTIVKVSRELGCDLIVIRTHGWTGLAHLLLGSLAEHIVRLADCPVLTVKGPVKG